MLLCFPSLLIVKGTSCADSFLADTSHHLHASLETIHMGSYEHTLLLVLLEETAVEGKVANPSQAYFCGLCCE